MNNSIPKQVLQGLKQVGMETGKEIAKEAGKIVSSTISAKEWLGDIKPLNDAEMSQQKQDEEKKKQEELNKVRAQMGQGRNVEQEMEQIRKEKEEKEKEAEKAEGQMELQKQQQQVVGPVETVSSNPAHQKKARGSAFAGGKKKKSQPDMQQLSQTGEIKGKIDN